MKGTAPFFFVSSGRSGTAMVQKAISSVADVEMHHEYMVNIVQPLAVRRYLGLASAAEAAAALTATHVASIAYSGARHWGDSSNKLSWLIPDLAALLPAARFVHLVRDGRKVAGSYFRKLGDECYDDRSTAILQAYYDDPHASPAPPPEKKYWWPVPRSDNPDNRAFRRFSQFERIAWHWAEVNRTISTSLAELTQERTYFVRLEDLRDSDTAVRDLFAFLDLPCRQPQLAAFARPHNVNRPEDRLLDAQERALFEEIAGQTMQQLGYARRAEYVVKY
jgi:hypothetical protein